MNEAQLQAAMAAIVAMTVDTLTDEQLIALNLCALLDSNPRGRIFDYDAVAPLFTEAGGMRMHAETKVAVQRALDARLAKAGTP